GILERFDDADLAMMISPGALFSETASGPWVKLPSDGGAPGELAAGQTGTGLSGINVWKAEWFTNEEVGRALKAGEDPRVSWQILDGIQIKLRSLLPDVNLRTPPTLGQHQTLSCLIGSAIGFEWHRLRPILKFPERLADAAEPGARQERQID